MFLKKITILSILFFSLWISNVFAEETDWMSLAPKPVDYLWIDQKSAQSVINWRDPNMSYDSQTKINLDWSITEIPRQEGSVPKSSSPQFSCQWGKDALCSEKFTIKTSLFSPGGKSFVAKWGAQKTMTAFFTTLIQKLMVALWSLALLIMVIWAGFMIFAMWKDDSLNKWKTIFKSWVIALAIALSSYFMVSFLSYILYAVW